MGAILAYLKILSLNIKVKAIIAVVYKKEAAMALIKILVATM